MKIVAVVDAKFSGPHFLSFAAVRSYDDLPDGVDAVIVTDLSNARETAKHAIAQYGADRVLNSRTASYPHHRSATGRTMIQVAQPRWYVVQTHPHAERRRNALRRQGFHSLSAALSEAAAPCAAGRDVVRPLFPRYMFVAVDLAAQRWRSVIRLRRQPGWYAIGDESGLGAGSVVVKRYSSDRKSAGFVRLIGPPRFDAGGHGAGIGRRVLGLPRPLSKKMTESERVAVLLDLLGRKVRVVLDVDLICAA